MGEHPVEGHLADRVEETSAFSRCGPPGDGLSHVVVGSTVYSDAYAVWSVTGRSLWRMDGRRSSPTPVSISTGMACPFA